MVTEGTYGQLKGRWSVLLRMNEGGPTRVKTTTLASVVLHDVCIEKGDTPPAARFNKRSVVFKRGITSLHCGFKAADQNFNIHDQILKLQLTNMYATWLFKVPLWDM